MKGFDLIMSKYTGSILTLTPFWHSIIKEHFCLYSLDTDDSYYYCYFGTMGEKR